MRPSDPELRYQQIFWPNTSLSRRTTRSEIRCPVTCTAAAKLGATGGRGACRPFPRPSGQPLRLRASLFPSFFSFFLVALRFFSQHDLPFLRSHHAVLQSRCMSVSVSNFPCCPSCCDLRFAVLASPTPTKLARLVHTTFLCVGRRQKSHRDSLARDRYAESSASPTTCDRRFTTRATAVRLRRCKSTALVS